MKIFLEENELSQGGFSESTEKDLVKIGFEYYAVNSMCYRGLNVNIYIDNGGEYFIIESKDMSMTYEKTNPWTEEKCVRIAGYAKVYFNTHLAVKESFDDFADMYHLKDISGQANKIGNHMEESKQLKEGMSYLEVVSLYDETQEKGESGIYLNGRSYYFQKDTEENETNIFVDGEAAGMLADNSADGMYSFLKHWGALSESIDSDIDESLEPLVNITENNTDRFFGNGLCRTCIHFNYSCPYDMENALDCDDEPTTIISEVCDCSDYDKEDADDNDNRTYTQRRDDNRFNGRMR